MNRFFCRLAIVLLTIGTTVFAHAAKINSWQRPISSDSEEMAQKFYGEEWELSAMRLELLEKVKGQSGDCRLEELLGQLEWLVGSDAQALNHFMTAALDDGCQQGALNIYRASQLLLSEGETALFRESLERIWQNSGDIFRKKAAYDLLSALYDRYGQKNNLPEWPYLREWRLLGSFDNDHGKGFNTVYPPEEEVVESENYSGMLRPVSWRTVESSAGLFSFDNLLYPNNQAVSYGKIYVKAPSDGEYVLVLHTTASTAVWINGAEVFRDEYLSYNGVDNVHIRVNLAAGWNKILVKSAVLQQDWEFAAYFLKDRQPIVLESSPRDQLFTKATVLDQDNLLPDPAGLSVLEQVQLAAMRGQLRQAQGLISGIGGQVDNPLFNHWAAAVLMTQEHQGEALDILQQAFGNRHLPAARSLLLRANYYITKEIWDRAAADINLSIKNYPQCRLCRLENAGLMRRRGWPVEALGQLATLEQQVPDIFAVIRQKIELENQLGHADASFNLWRKLLKSQPGQPWLLQQARDYYRQQEQYKKAITYGRQLIGNDILNRNSAISLAGIYHSARNDAAASEILSKIIKQTPDWYKPYMLLAQYAQEQGAQKEAIAYYQQALELDPHNSQLAEHIDHLQNNSFDLVPNYLPTDDYINDLIAGADEVQILPGVNTIYLLDHEITILNQDGSAKRVVTQVTRAINTEGRDALISENLPKRGTVKILQAYARQPDGTRQEAASIRDKVIRFRGIEVGSTTVIQYVHYCPQQVFLPQHFATDWYFQGVQTQHELSQWVLAVPKNKTLLHKISNPEMVDVLQKEEGDYRLYIFSASSMPPMIKENDMPSIDDYLAKVSVTTVPSWDEYVAWDKSLVTTALQQDAKVGELARKLTTGSGNKLSAFWQLFSFVSNEIRYQNDYENTIAGVRPHAPALVLERGYGDCKDKALLMIALGEAVGIKIDYVSVRTRPYGEVNRDQPDQQFNHAIIYVPEQDGIGEGFFMDPTVDALDIGNLRVDDQGTLALVMDVKTGAYRFERIPFSPFEKEQKQIKIAVEIQSATQARALVSIETRGQTGAALRQLVRNDSLAKQLYMYMASSTFPGATTIHAEVENSVDYSQPAVLHMVLDISGSLVRHDGEISLKLPGVAPNPKEVQLESRHFPLWFLNRAGADSVVEIKLPEGAKINRLPDAYHYGRPEIMEVERQVVQNGQHINIINRWQRNAVQIEPADYPQYRDDVNQAVNKNGDLLQFTLP